MHFDPLLLEARADKNVASAQATVSDGLHYPSRISDGGTFDRISGTVEVMANLTRTKEETEEADETIQEVLARVWHTLRTHRSDIRAIPEDDYGCKIHDFTVIDIMEYDSGAKTANTTRSFVRYTAIILAAGR